MKKVNWFSGMEVFDVDFKTLQSYFEERLNLNMCSFVNKGVVVSTTLPNGIELNPPYVWSDQTTLGIYGLVAYDNGGQMIFSAPTYRDGELVPTVSNLVPENIDGTGKLIVGGHPYKADVEFYIVIRYAESLSQTEFRTQEGTKLKLPVRIETGFELYSRPVGGILSGDVVLAKITTDTLGNITVDESVRDTFGIKNSLLTSSVTTVNTADGSNSNISLEGHINMLGTGQWSVRNPHALSAEDLGIDSSATGKHQFYLHSDGIKTDDMTTTTSALYPYYLSSSLTSEERLVISPLADTLNEIVVVNGETLNPAAFPNQYTFDFSSLASSEYSGYHIFAISASSKSIERLGPYDSEDNAVFLSNLESRNYFPICSLYWGKTRTYVMVITLDTPAGEVKITCSSEAVLTQSNGESILAKKVKVRVVNEQGDETQAGTQLVYKGTIGTVTAASRLTPESDSYDIDPLSFRDRRVFNNTSFKDIQPQDLCALRDAAPLTNGTSKLYNARVIANSKNAYYNVSGNTGSTFDIAIDGVTYPTYTFIGAESLSIDQVIEQLNNYVSLNYSGDGNTPKVIKNWEGRITIIAEKSIQILDSGTANEELGFDDDFNNMSDSGDDIKCIIFEGGLPSRQEIYYENDLIKKIYYITSGNYLRKHTLNYNSDDFISSVNEEVSVLGSEEASSDLTVNQ